METYRRHLDTVFKPYLEARDGRVAYLAGAMVRTAYDREYARRCGYWRIAERFGRHYVRLARKLGADPLVPRMGLGF